LNINRDSNSVNQQSRSYGVVTALVVVILVLGSIVIYQQIEISTLSGTISRQSSELAPPIPSLKVLNFTVTKLNATAKPIMYLVFLNNGTALAWNLGILLIGVSSGTTFQSCYNGTQNILPTYPNESAMTISQLNCGEIGNAVALTASVVFVTNQGTTTKVFSARTTITQAEFSPPTTVTVNQIGIHTYVMPELFGENTTYDWHLVITNDSPTPIVSVNETAFTVYGSSFTSESCVVFPNNVGWTSPLEPSETCMIDNNLPPAMGHFELGEQLRIAIGIKFVNGTTSSATTAAMVIPPYVPYE